VLCQREARHYYVDTMEEWIRWILIVLLLSMSALFSGLNLGLMGLDKNGLEVAFEMFAMHDLHGLSVRVRLISSNHMWLDHYGWW